MRLDTMQVDAAIDQLSEIYVQLLRSEVFRGYRSRPIAATALLAVGGAIAWPFAPLADGAGFAIWWAAIAIVGVAVCGADVFIHVWQQGSAHERRRALWVVSQLAPSFAAGVALPFVLLRPEVDGVSLLPGLWALLFGLAVFASRPFLPRAAGWVGLWYCGSGVLQLWFVAPGIPSPWSMGVTFGVGQALAALVLRLRLERPLEAA